MYLVDTGAANEHVPLNETGYLLPLWQVGRGWEGCRSKCMGACSCFSRALCNPAVCHAAGGSAAFAPTLPCRPSHLLALPQRLVIRSAFVALLTFLAICMPFFNVVVGLVGR